MACKIISRLSEREVKKQPCTTAELSMISTSQPIHYILSYKLWRYSNTLLLRQSNAFDSDSTRHVYVTNYNVESTVYRFGCIRTVSTTDSLNTMPVSSLVSSLDWSFFVSVKDSALDFFEDAPSSWWNVHLPSLLKTEVQSYWQGMQSYIQTVTIF